MHEFSYNATSGKREVTPTPARPTSDIVPATQHTGTCQRKNTDKAEETLCKRTLLGREMVAIGAQQSKSAPESKLSYPAGPSTDMYAVDLRLHHPSLILIFRRNC